MSRLNEAESNILYPSTTGGGGGGGDMLGSNNLSDLTDIAQARINLGVVDSPDRFAGEATGNVVGGMAGNLFAIGDASEIDFVVNNAGRIIISSGGLFLQDDRATPAGFEYDGDYSANYTDLSLIAKKDAWFTKGTSILTDNTNIDVNTRVLFWQTANSGFSFRDNKFDVEITDGGSADVEFIVSTTGITIGLSSGLSMKYQADYSADYTSRSLVDKAWVLSQIGGGGGATTALDNLASVAINAALLPGADSSIGLGSTTKQWTTLFLGNGGGLNWLNGQATITHATGSTLVYASSDGGHQFFKAGQASYIQILNPAATEGLKLSTLTAAPSVGTVSNSGTVLLAPQAAETIGIGTISVVAGKLNIAPGTTSLCQIHLELGVAPTSPHDGDIWLESNTNTGLKIRINGVTKTITLS